MRSLRYGIPLALFFALCLGASQAQAKSCSSFAVIKAFDAEASTIEVEWEKGKQRKYFPKPEGTPTDTSKIPKKCSRKVLKQTTLNVKATGGRLSVTQIRTNFEGKMLNDTDDKAWLPGKLQQLIADKTKVVVVLRPGMKRTDTPNVTTVYLPITDEELAEIKRLEDQATDV